MTSSLMLNIILGLFLAQTPNLNLGRTAPEVAPDFTFHVLNSKNIGRKMVHLEDLVGRSAKTVSNMPPAATVLLVGLELNCEKCDAAWSLLVRAEALAAKQNGRVIGVLWTDDETVSELSRNTKISSSKAMIAWDAHKLVPALFGLSKVGGVLLVRGDGSVDSRFVKPVKNIKRVMTVFNRSLKEGG
ncbi:MAG: hypothetical protein VYC39_11435 [Myxococcota bacterium]|nr:hypothetical protein [Myxococcota bacterium]